MKKELEKIYSFLEENREFNKRVQEKSYESVIIPHDNVGDKVISLVYHTANTQSQPKINELSKLYKKLHESHDKLSSFEEFLRVVGRNDNYVIKYKELYNCMLNQSGLGEKTAALFVKKIYHLHNGNYSGNLKIWNDVPKIIGENDDFYLPVDTVIKAIFEKLEPTEKWNFKKINAKIKEFYNGDEIEVWDDLWFWGFFTQKVYNKERIFEWNENKYWASAETDKDPEVIKRVEKKAKGFLELFR